MFQLWEYLILIVQSCVLKNHLIIKLIIQNTNMIEIYIETIVYHKETR